MSSVSVSVVKGDPFVSAEVAYKNLTELQNYLKCVEGNKGRFMAITDIQVFYYRYGRAVTQEELPEFRRERVMKFNKKIFDRIISGKMEINGKPTHWSNGSFGSRWFDLDSQSTALTARVAFANREEVGCEKPYMIRIAIEDREVVKCEGCEQTSKWFKKCSCCHWRSYCSVECQKKDWKRHKAEMKEEKESE